MLNAVALYLFGPVTDIAAGDEVVRQCNERVRMAVVGLQMATSELATANAEAKLTSD